MPEPIAYQATKFGAGSSKQLATKGGAVFAGVWISTKGTSPTITVYDAAASTTGSDVVPSTIVTAVGNQALAGPINCGTGLFVKTASCTGVILWRPSSAGV
jgi:hypothetical protein